jgi:hypothetical protein
LLLFLGAFGTYCVGQAPWGLFQVCFECLSLSCDEIAL